MDKWFYSFRVEKDNDCDIRTSSLMQYRVQLKTGGRHHVSISTNALRISLSSPSRSENPRMLNQAKVGIAYC